MKVQNPPVVRQAALITLAEITPSGDWRKPSRERAEWWFSRMRAAVNDAPDSVCLLCGRVVTGVPCCY